MTPTRLLAPLLLPLAVLACAAPETAGPPELVYAPAGTPIRLVNTVDGVESETRITASVARGLRGAFVRADGTVGSFYPGCWDCGAPAEIEEDLYAALWPLAPGKEVGFLRSAPDGTRARIVISVVGPETVETEAGRFETWRLAGRMTMLTGASLTAEVTAWWAPDPGWVVKAEGRDSAGKILASEVAAFGVP
ncbi:MAG: hypothetical protein AAF908_06290 [Pseudomonadota bacterium]